MRKKLVYITGIDEAGKIGDDIVFAGLEVPLPHENRLILYNIKFFGKPVIRKNDLKGKTPNYLLKYVSAIKDDRAFKLRLFKLDISDQNKLMQSFYEYLSQELFRHRGHLIEALKTSSFNEISPVIEFLKPFQDKLLVIESCIKSYGMMLAVKHLLKNFISGLLAKLSADSLYVVQIDGGYPFAFWWRRLREYILRKEISSKLNLTFIGISKGDQYYPILSAAGTISSIILDQKISPFFIDVTKLHLDEERDIYSDHSHFHREHFLAFLERKFMDRLLFLGKIGNNLKQVIPYVMHRFSPWGEGRSKTFEAFTVEKNIESFFKRFGRGSPKNTRVIYGLLETDSEKEDLRRLSEAGYECIPVNDLERYVFQFMDELERELSLLPSSSAEKFSSSLTQIRTIYEKEFRTL